MPEHGYRRRYRPPSFGFLREYQAIDSEGRKQRVPPQLQLAPLWD